MQPCLRLRLWRPSLTFMERIPRLQGETISAPGSPGFPVSFFRPERPKEGQPHRQSKEPCRFRKQKCLPQWRRLGAVPTFPWEASPVCASRAARVRGRTSEAAAAPATPGEACRGRVCSRLAHLLLG